MRMEGVVSLQKGRTIEGVYGIRVYAGQDRFD